MLNIEKASEDMGNYLEEKCTKARKNEKNVKKVLQFVTGR